MALLTLLALFRTNCANYANCAVQIFSMFIASDRIRHLYSIIYIVYNTERLQNVQNVSDYLDIS